MTQALTYSQRYTSGRISSQSTVLIKIGPITNSASSKLSSNISPTVVISIHSIITFDEFVAVYNYLVVQFGFARSSTPQNYENSCWWFSTGFALRKWCFRNSGGWQNNVAIKWTGENPQRESTFVVIAQYSHWSSVMKKSFDCFPLE